VIASGQLVFVSGVGFRSAASAMLATPVSDERGEWQVTIERLVVGPDKTELVYALTGPGAKPLEPGDHHDAAPPWARLPVSLRSSTQTLDLTNEGRQGPMEMSGAPRSTYRTVRPTLRFPPLAPGTDQLDVVFDGAPGNWAVPLTLTSSTTYGIPARAIDVRDEHHGVTLTAAAIARSETMTAIDISTSLAPTPQPRFMRCLGVQRHTRGDDPQFTLRDDMGNELREFAVFDDEVTSGRELHQILVFPAVNADAIEATLTISDLVLAETTGAPVTLPVPSESDLEFWTFKVHAVVSRETGGRGPVVRVSLDDGGWTDDRRLLYPESVRVNGRHGGIGWDRRPTPGQPMSVDAPDPLGDAREVTLESPVVRLSGPWRLELPL
jgi:hypothetical protein